MNKQLHTHTRICSLIDFFPDICYQFYITLTSNHLILKILSINKYIYYLQSNNQPTIQPDRQPKIKQASI